MASSANSIDWMPAKGRHPVNIGSSLGRALKNRKNKGSPAPATKRSNLPERDFYCFKFNFKASSVDTSRPAAIEIKKGTENNHVTAEYPSTQAGEVHMFSGNEQPAKDVDCILIFDEETGTFTLEKLDSFVLLKFDRKQAASSRPDSPAPLAASSSSSSAKGKGRQEDYDMDRGMSTMDEDAEGEVDDTQEPPVSSYQREEGEEEEEGEEIEIPLRQALQSKAKPPAPAPAPARPVKSLPKSRTEANVAPPTLPTKPKMPPPPVATPAPVATKAPAPAPAKSKPPPTAAAAKTKKTKAAAAPLSSYVSEEIIEFGRPAKRVRPSTPQQPPPPPAPAPVALSLPGGSSSFAPPPAPASYRPGGAAGSSSTNNNNDNGHAAVTHPEPVVPALMDADLSEEDEDWEQVPTATPTIPQAANPAFSSHLTLEEENQLEEEIFGNGFADQEEEGEMDNDEDEYEEGGVEIDPFELEEQMEEEGEDFLNGVLSPAPEGEQQLQQQQQTRRPMSMNELAGGGAAAVGVDSDDEFSSSDESEDD